MPTPPPILIEVVERALEPYARIFSPETIECMREEALAQLAAHPYSAALLDALAAPPSVHKSDALAPGGLPADQAVKIGKGAA